MALAEIHVTLKPTLLDVQGATVLKALHHLGHTQVQDVRIGKFITVQVDDSLTGAALEQALDAMCQSLLANPVIEDYEITIIGPPSVTESVVATAPATGPLLPNPHEIGDAPATPRSALSVGEQLATGQISEAETATPEPFAVAYDVYEALPATEKLALQDLAWRKHEAWVKRQLSDHRAAWIVCVGGSVVESGDTMDTFPSDTRLAQLGAANNLVPWVFTRPPQ